MGDIYISKLIIENVRHLKNIQIPLSEEMPKHLILTGKNGSGKTSVLEAMAQYLEVASGAIFNYMRPEKRPSDLKDGVCIEFNERTDILKNCFMNGQFVLAYYKANRIFRAEISRHIEKISFKKQYAMDEQPRTLFVKYLADLKVTEALARNSGKQEKADEIKLWFEKFQELLRKIFEEDSLELVFDEESFSFMIQQKNREPFDFNTLSSGFAAVLDIVLDLIVRMEKQSNRSFTFNMPGIVLIDEIETHLHLDVQKTILNMLTTLFPNIQFIVSTHSPFILNSLENVVIYDLENNTIVENGLTNVPYSGIVEGYFNTNELSSRLQEKFDRYKVLVEKPELTDDDFEEIAELELFLEEIPDYLALNLTTEYQRLKMELEHREDMDD
ncbi:MAG: AAA family ATPase [Lachnospiraceae bacterium]|nr:AAA family ATPase [Lachnospiraceae bacterium]